MGGEPKTTWEKVDIVLKPAGALLTALVVAWLGLQGRAILEARQSAQTRSQLYAQLMSSREQSDSALRQSMFQTIIDEFLTSDSRDAAADPSDGAALLARYNREVLKLEVLAYNFHEALDLAPLFKDVHRRLTDLETLNDPDIDFDELDDLVNRLEKVAKEVTDKQLAALEGSGAVRRAKIDLETFFETEILQDLINETLVPRDNVPVSKTLAGKRFSVDVVGVDTKRKEVEVRLTIWPLDSAVALVDVTFNVGFFDFPMIDNTRLVGGERCAIVLDGFDQYHAGIALVYFPGSRASLKEKPFYDEIIQDLVDRPAADGRSTED